MTYSFKMTVRDCAYSCWPSSVFVKKLKFFIMINGGILSDSHHYHRRQKLAIALKLFHGAMSWDLGVVQYVFPLNAKSFRSVPSRLRPTVKQNLFRVVGVSKFTTAVTRKMNHFCATAVAKAVPLQENFHSGTSK